MMQRIVFAFLSLAIGSILLGGCGFFAPDYQYQGSVLEPPQAIPDISLTKTNGEVFRLSDLSDDIVLFYFGYTFCPDFCPLTLNKAGEAVAQLETGQERIHIIFVSVDPERDTPEAIEVYLNSFREVYGANFVGLTAEWAELEMAMQPFGAYAVKEDASNSAASYLVSHTTRLYVVTPEGEWLLHYPFEAETEAVRADLAYLVSQLD